MSEYTEGRLDFDGEDTVASQDWGGDGFQVFTRGDDGEVDESVGTTLERADAIRWCAAWNAMEGIDEIPDARVSELVEALAELYPANVRDFPKTIADHEIIPLDVTVGELRRAAAVIKKWSKP